MKIIPVIDYMHGQVVLAEKGMRGSYQAVNSELCKHAELHSVIKKLLSLANFSIIYIADLDSIENQNLNLSLWPQIFATYPQLEFWCDIGAQVSAWNRIMNNTSNARPIVGSESFNNLADLTATIEDIKEARPLLSLDIKDGMPLGPRDLLSNFRHWPEEIIVLSLNRVGSFAGPDYNTIETLAAQLPDSKKYVGGGVRDVNDINQLESLGISGVLLAKSLHTQAVSAEDLAKFTS